MGIFMWDFSVTLAWESTPVAKNEFNNLFKLVRKSHVQTDIQWTKTWKPARLIDYSKCKWFGYEYLEKT